MKLYYYRFAGRGLTNFGDALNPWLWGRLLPGVFDDDGRVIFVGIGTLINQNLVNNKALTKVIFSTGLGYLKGSWRPKKEDNWKIYCVRGPLTAKALGISEKYSITDGAVLVSKFIKAADRKDYRYSYMPHKDVLWNDADGGAYKEVCEHIGFGYIDPTWGVDKVLSCIAKTEILLTDAMHGAIVADALRIPWIPLKNMPDLLEFKWLDWCMSINVPYKSYTLIRLLKPRLEDKGVLKLRNIKFELLKMRAAEQLKSIARKKPFLSENKKIGELTRSIDEKLLEFCDDFKKGRFFV